jgi:hypothetical protein
MKLPGVQRKMEQRYKILIQIFAHTLDRMNAWTAFEQAAQPCSLMWHEVPAGLVHINRSHIC